MKVLQVQVWQNEHMNTGLRQFCKFNNLAYFTETIQLEEQLIK